MCAELPDDLVDRDLTDDVDVASRVLPALASLSPTRRNPSTHRGWAGIGRSSSAYDTDVRRSTPAPLTVYWPSRHNGGEYACTEHCPGPSR